MPDMIGGNPLALTQVQRETIDTVCDACSELNAQQLSDMTHS